MDGREEKEVGGRNAGGVCPISHVDDANEGEIREKDKYFFFINAANVGLFDIFRDLTLL